MTEATAPGLRLWDDNPSIIDLLGFDAVVDPILEAIKTPHLDPVTIGVQSPWGGGKSTVINLVFGELFEDPAYVVIRSDPWQYDNHDDVRGILIAEILNALRERFDSDGTLGKRVEELLGRIAWSRVALAVGKGVVGLGWSPEDLAKALTPRKRSEPETMSGFKEAFSELLDLLPKEVQRVVVLIDDLDRCLPPAVMGTLEAIKLFLAVPKMVFVLAADQELIRDAVAAHLAGTNRSESFAHRYLEKIVQLPISLPRLSEEEAETYIALLLAEREAPSTDAFDAVADHAAARRNANTWPLLSEWPEGLWRPSDEVLHLARQLRDGLAADKLSSPRQIKRFLNAYGVRAVVAASRCVALPPPIAVKLLLLEDRHRQAFERLAGWPASERQAHLEHWEQWAADERSDAPEGIDESTKDWALAGPSLIGVDLTPYLRLAASLVNAPLGGAVSDAIVALVQDLLDDSEAAQMAAIVQALALAPTEQAAAMSLLLDNGLRGDDPNTMWVSAIRWAKDAPVLVEAVVNAVRRHMGRLTLAVPIELKATGVAAMVSLLEEVAASTTAPEEVVEAARMEIEP